MEELWFNVQVAGKQASGDSATDKRQQTSNAAVITGVCGFFKDRQSPLDDLLNKILSSRESAGNRSLQDQFSVLVDALIEGLIDAATSIDSVRRFKDIFSIYHLVNIATRILSMSSRRSTSLL